MMYRPPRLARLQREESRRFLKCALGKPVFNGVVLDVEEANASAGISNLRRHQLQTIRVAGIERRDVDNWDFWRRRSFHVQLSLWTRSNLSVAQQSCQPLTALAEASEWRKKI